MYTAVELQHSETLWDIKDSKFIDLGVINYWKQYEKLI